jgi:hypothetical protein
LASKAASNTARKRSSDASRLEGGQAIPHLSPGRTGTLVLLALISALQIWGLAHYFPPATWLGPEPFYTNSYALHFARGLRQAESLRAHARLWSYSPALMAGYPAGTATEPMGAAVGPWLVVSEWMNPAVAYKALVLGLLAAAPFAAALAAWGLELDTDECLIAAMFGAMGTFSAPGLAMTRAGMFAFFSASYLCLALSCLMYRCARHGGSRLFVVLAVAGGAITYLHPLTPLLLAGPAAGVLLETVRQPRRWAALVASFVGIFIIALGWLGPILLTHDLRAYFSQWWHTPTSFLPAARELLSARLNFPPLILLGLMFLGLVRIRLSRWYKASLCTTTLVFCVLAYFGSMISATDVVEPVRFEAPFYFYAVPFVAAGARELWGRLSALRRGLRYPAWAVALITVLFYCWIPFYLADFDLSSHGRILGRLPEQGEELTRWITASDPESRLLVESGWSTQDDQLLLPYFGADVGLLWAVESGRELIGASPTERFSIYRFADFGNGVAFGRPLEQWSPDEFRKQLEIYNVGSAILWSDQAKQFFAALPDSHLLAQSEPFELYGLSGTRSFLFEGRAASVRAYEDCIQLKGAEPGRLVLKYHYFRTLRAAPTLALIPVAAGNGDPVPFIGLVNDVRRDITIYNAGFLGLDRPACGR